MKSILFVLLLVLGANAFTLNRTADKLPESFMAEYIEIITAMESACTDTILNAKIKDQGNESVILLKIKVDCDYSMANKMLKTFYTTYLAYFNNNQFDKIIDSTTKAMFPQYEFMWGVRFNNTTDPYIERTLPYNTTLGNNNKSVFYSVITDKDTITNIRSSFNGHSLDYMGRAIHSNVFYYKVYTKAKNITNVYIQKTNFYKDNYTENSGKLPILD